MLRTHRMDPKTAAWLGGWDDITLFMKTYALAIKDATLTETIFDMPLTPSTKDQENQGLDKRKDPSGGTTGRVKPYGRLGWMGARAEYSRWGGITAPTFISRSSFAGRSKGRSIFLTFYSGGRPEITA